MTAEHFISKSMEYIEAIGELCSLLSKNENKVTRIYSYTIADYLHRLKNTSVAASNQLWLYENKKLILDYDEWLSEFGDQVQAELAEKGADKELDFDLEKEFEKIYNEYRSNK